MKRLFMVVLLFFITVHYGNNIYALQAKGILIKGKVINEEDGQALEGVSVVPKGSKEGTGTQADGTFSIELPEGTRVIVITADGFEDQEITITDKKNITVSLKRQTSRQINVVALSYLQSNFYSPAEKQKPIIV